MRRPKTLQAFTEEQRKKAHILLATHVAFMMGRKMEEADWASVYCKAKGIPEQGWSNLKIDVMHQGLGVEHKMLRLGADEPAQSICGTRPMHPAATRSIRIPSLDADPNDVMRDVLSQYANLIKERSKAVAADAPGKKPDLRFGWLFWQTSLKEFLYFEEEMLPPNPNDYRAEWKETSRSRVGRKASKNLWVYEKETGHKRYSITTSAGAKIQPYFDVPPPDDPNLYIFKVQGEEVRSGVIRIWLAKSTARELKAIVDDLSLDNLSVVVSNAAAAAADIDTTEELNREAAIPIEISTDTYRLLVGMFPGAASDEHMAQLLITQLRREEDGL